MAYGTPANPVSGTVITTAYATANLLDPIRWLRLLTGNADPPGTDYVVVSSSTVGTAWAKLTGNQIADGSVPPTKLTYTPVNKAGDTQIGNLALAPGAAIVLGNGGMLADVSGGGTRINANDNTLLVQNEAGTAQILNADATRLLVPTSRIDLGGGSRIVESSALEIRGHGDTVVLLNAAGLVQLLNADTTRVKIPTRIALSENGQLYDAPSGATTLLSNANTFVVSNAANTVQILNADTNRLLIPTRIALANGSQILDAADLQILANGDQITIRSEAGSNTLLQANSTQLVIPGSILFASGSRILESAALIVQANGDTLVVTNEAGSTQLLNASAAGLQINGSAAITAATIGSQTVAAAANATNATNATNAGNATTVGGLTPTTAPGPNRIPISDATGTLNSWITGPSIGTPTGLIAGWDGTAATIPSGWTRFTAADGRLLIGDGTTFSQTFTTQTSYGSAWLHQHGAGGLTFTGAASATAGPTGVNGLATAGGVNLPTDSHTHSFTPSGAIGGSDAPVTWLPPMRAIVWIRRT